MSDVWQTIEQAAVTLGLSVRTVNRHITAGKLQSRLFEGRREVLVERGLALEPAGSPTRHFDPNTTEIKGSNAPSPTSPHGGGGASDRFSDSEQTTGDEPNDRISSDRISPRFSSAHQAVQTQISAQRPLDSQMMLALADSIDDKATLAVAAYQTLARSSETQVQSLRRVAFGAWATVVIIAIGIIIAVGWGTYRLTAAETTATFLNKAGADLTSQVNRVTNERDDLRKEAERLRADTDMLRRQLVEQDVQAAHTAALAELSAANTQIKRLVDTILRFGATMPATQPTAATPSTGNPIATTPSGPAPVFEVPATGPFQFSNPSVRNSPTSLTRPAPGPPVRMPNQPNPQGVFGVN